MLLCVVAGVTESVVRVFSGIEQVALHLSDDVSDEIVICIAQLQRGAEFTQIGLSAVRSHLVPLVG